MMVKLILVNFVLRVLRITVFASVGFVRISIFNNKKVFVFIK
jgi:hypothetical protein